MIFSFDSILAAAGMIKHLIIMMIAICIANGIMILAFGSISIFINNHSTLQMLALSFLILIAFILIPESIDMHVPKGYIYFAVFFSLIVEFLNIQLRKNQKKYKTKYNLIFITY